MSDVPSATQPASTDVPVSTGTVVPSNDPAHASGLWGKLTDGNPYFSAGFGLMAVGVGLSLLRQSGLGLISLAQRRMLVSLEIPSRDTAYPWFLQWIAMEANRSSAKKGLKLWSNALSVETSYKKHLNGSADVLFSVVPGIGTHLFRYKGAWMQLKRDRQTNMMPGPTDGRPFETLSLTTLAKDKHLFPILLDEARQVFSEAEKGAMVVHMAMGTTWQRFGPPRTKRTLESVILDDAVAEHIEQDVQAFMHRSKWYADRGLPYRRGYLLHGPPGSGKSSFIQALAGRLNYDIAILNLSQRGMMDDKLDHLLLNAPGRSFILLEDIDAAFNKRVQTSADGYQSGVTFSGLLNALDGVASAEERILFMTTNHIERLDPALIRPGRIDVTALIDDASPLQARRLFLKFYGDRANSDNDAVGTGVSVNDLAEEMATVVRERSVGGKRVSMAALQGHFIRNDSPKRAIDMASELFV